MTYLPIDQDEEYRAHLPHWTDEEGNPRICAIEDRVQMDSRYNLRNLAEPKRKRPNKAQRLARRVWNGMGDVIVWLLVLGGLAVFVYAVLGHGK